jgi:hypothetical protein
MSQLVMSGYEPDIQATNNYSFSHKVKINLYMFHPSMKDWIRRQVCRP